MFFRRLCGRNRPSFAFSTRRNVSRENRRFARDFTGWSFFFLAAALQSFLIVSATDTVAFSYCCCLCRVPKWPLLFNFSREDTRSLLEVLLLSPQSFYRLLLLTRCIFGWISNSIRRIFMLIYHIYLQWIQISDFQFCIHKLNDIYI